LKKQKVKDDLTNQIATKTLNRKNNINREKMDDNDRITSDTLKINNEERAANLFRVNQQQVTRRVLDLQK
jgi:hypothetical protein